MRRHLLLLIGAGLLIWIAPLHAQDTTDPTPAPDSGTVTEPRSREDAPTGQRLEVGQRIRGELSSERTTIDYVVMFNTDTIYRVDLSSEDFDTYLTLLTPNGDLIVEDDDGGQGTNSRLAAFVPEADGAVVIQVSSFGAVVGGSAGSGSFSLLVEPIRTRQLSINEVMSGDLAEGESVVFTFNGRAGDVIAVSATSSQLDTVLTLSRAGEEVARDDDGGEGTNALIGPVTLPADDEYYIGLSSYFGDQSGDYALAVGRAEASVMDLGEKVTLTVSPGVPEILLMDVFEGDLLELAFTGNTYFALEDEEGFFVTEGTTRVIQDDSPPPPVSVEIADSGQHALILVPEMSGELDISLALGGYVTVDAAGQMVALNQDGLGFARFEVTAGELVTVTLVPQDNDDWDLVLEVLQDGNIVGRYAGFGGEALTFTMTFPEAGEVQLRLSDVAYTDAYEVQVVRSVPEEKD